MMIDLLNEKVEQYNSPNFIELDPISIPHRYTKKEDIEISGFFAATFAWGQRKTIINKTTELMSLMDNSPYDFIINHRPEDLKAFANFKHRTFNYEDTLFFIHSLKEIYTKGGLEKAFSSKDKTIETGINNFYNIFFAPEFSPKRTRKHVASPQRKSACKRINMFLRWMVRKDNKGVDFGIWNSISPAELICPLDVHVERISRHLGLISRKQIDWATAEQLTQELRKLDPKDPVKYDFALFGLGIENYFLLS